MPLSKILFSIFIIQIFKSVSSEKSCSDCQVYTSCGPAVALLTKRDESTIQLFRNAWCGFEKDPDVSRPKICCSMFQVPIMPRPYIETNEEFDVEKLNLLPSNCGRIPVAHILSGWSVCQAENPWLALIAHQERDGLHFICEGSVVTSKYILTSANCVPQDKVVSVRLGAGSNIFPYLCQDYNQEEFYQPTTQDFAIERIIQHEDYDAVTQENDIALLRLEEEIEFNKVIAPICLPVTRELRNKNLTDETAVIASIINADSRGTHDSYIVSRDVVPITNCDDMSRYSSRVISYENVICTENHQNFQYGLYGGPLIVDEMFSGNRRYIQFGVTSRRPRVLTDVRKYISWILNNIEA